LSLGSMIHDWWILTNLLCINALAVHSSFHTRQNQVFIALNLIFVKSILGTYVHDPYMQLCRWIISNKHEIWPNIEKYSICSLFLSLASQSEILPFVLQTVSMKFSRSVKTKKTNYVCVKYKQDTPSIF